MDGYAFSYKHYITVREDGAITGGWSSGASPERDTAGAVCINDQGGYQFRLSPDGEENPALYDRDGIPLFKWDGKRAVPRTEQETEAERAAIPAPPPSEIDRLRADVDFLAAIGGIEL